MDALLECVPDPPMRIKSLSCDNGGLAASCCARSWPSFSDHECTLMSPCTRTSPGPPALICASPLPLVNSMRTGPFTVKDLSNVPSALDCGLQPASTKAAQAASEIQPSLCERVMCVIAVSSLASRTSALATPGHPSYQRYTRKRNQKFPAGQVLILWQRTSVRHRLRGHRRRWFRETESPLRRLNLQKGIQRTLAIAFQIHGDKCEASGLHTLGNLPRDVRLKSTSELIGSNLNPRQFSVRPHTKLPELERAQHGLRPIDFLQQLSSYRRTIRHARRKTSRSGTVPSGQSSSPRKKANLSLVKLGVQQRRQHMMLVRRAMSWPKIARVVSVDPVSNGRDSARQRQLIHLIK